MNLNLIGHQLEITPALRSHVSDKLSRIRRHFDHVIDVHVTLSTNRVGQRAEASLHLPGKEIHCECEQADLYAAIDLLIDKLDRQVLKYKDLHYGRPAGSSRHGETL
jgi:putative sigma-54 modulation protein